jgi:S-adenosylmethionine:tRNA ribosyltransferase-isomerase
MSVSRSVLKQVPAGWLVPCEPDPAEFTFVLPAAREAGEPPEAHGLSRDEVRLMVSYIGDCSIEHTHFRSLENYLTAGDLLVVNTSGTLNAALKAWRADGQELELHLSTRLPGELWVVELRLPGEPGTEPFFLVRQGKPCSCPGEA